MPIPQKVYDSQFNQKYVSNINYIKTITYICIIIIMINQKVIDLATSFLLNRSESDDKLNNSSKEELIKLVNDLLSLNLNDPNFSSLAEAIPLSLAGYKSHDVKHGKDGFIGESYDTAVKLVEQKPKKTLSVNHKLDGGGAFADYTLHRLEEDKSLGDKLNLMISGFIDGNLIYVFEVPHNHPTLMNHIEKKTKDCISKGKRVLPSFSYTAYSDCKDIKVVFMRDDIDNYSNYMSKNFFDFLKKLK